MVRGRCMFLGLWEGLIAQTNPSAHGWLENQIFRCIILKEGIKVNTSLEVLKALDKSLCWLSG